MKKSHVPARFDIHPERYFLHACVLLWSAEFQTYLSAYWQPSPPLHSVNCWSIACVDNRGVDMRNMISTAVFFPLWTQNELIWDVQYLKQSWNQSVGNVNASRLFSTEGWPLKGRFHGLVELHVTSEQMVVCPTFSYYFNVQLHHKIRCCFQGTEAVFTSVSAHFQD